MTTPQYHNIQHTGMTTTTTAPVAGYPVMQPPPPTIIGQSMVAPTIYRVAAIRNLGITQLIFGVLTIICGIVVLAASPYFWFSVSGSGIWTGIFIVIAGSLCIASATNPERNGIRYAALTFCIISTVVAFIAGILAYIGFITMLTCTPCDSYSSYSYSYCTYDCYKNAPTMIASILVSIMMTVEFIISIIASVYTGRSCCCPSYSTGTVIVQPNAYSGTVITSNTSTGYAVPYSGTPYSGPPNPYSVGYQQQYTQAPITAQGAYTGENTGVTYGTDYKSIEQAAPPPYSGAN